MLERYRRRQCCRKPAVLADSTKEKKCIEEITSGVVVKVLGRG